jgi:3-hydroxy-9,10-secoandrosta-1,3,5(10)-triene-9,17-dione monooxygenase
MDADPVFQARALAPLLAHHAAEAEAQRRPHDAVIDALGAARLFSLLTPPQRGGRRVALPDYLETIAALGEGCVSSAWVCSFYAVHSWMVCLFDARAQDEVLRDGHVRAPGLVAPRGAAIPAAGGHVVTGRWEFGSGVTHADWALLTALTRARTDAAPDGARFFLIPRDAAEIIDTWYVDGMAATGSCDVAVHAVFVPHYRSLDAVHIAAGVTPGATLYPDDGLYRQPLPPLLAFVAVAPALGAARASVREMTEQAKTRKRSWATGRHAQRPAVQMRLAEADMRVRCAELLLRTTANEIEALAPNAPVAVRARLRMQCSWALTLCTQALESLAEVAGAHAHQRSEPLQRRLRDLRMMRCHVIFEPDATAELYGRTLFGLDPETLLV